MEAMDFMTPRERMIACVEGKKTDRLPFAIHWGPWGDAHRRWKQEGMENDNDWHALFNFDSAGVGTGLALPAGTAARAWIGG